MGQGYEGVSRRSPKVFQPSQDNPLLHLEYGVISRRLTRSDDFPPPATHPDSYPYACLRLRRHYSTDANDMIEKAESLARDNPY